MEPTWLAGTHLFGSSRHESYLTFCYHQVSVHAIQNTKRRMTQLKKVEACSEVDATSKASFRSLDRSHITDIQAVEGFVWTPNSRMCLSCDRHTLVNFAKALPAPEAVMNAEMLINTLSSVIICLQGRIAFPRRRTLCYEVA